MNEQRSQERPFKMVLLGDTGVGKTSLALRFVKGTFDQDSYPTIGAAYMTKSYQLGMDNYRYEIWDTAGQERYKAITPLYYRCAEGAMIVFDVSVPETFEAVKSWYGQVKSELGERFSKVPVSLVANKADLIKEIEGDNQLDYDTMICLNNAENFAKENGLGFFKVSAKTGKGIDEPFEYLALNLPSKEEMGNLEQRSGTQVNLTRREMMEDKFRETCCQNG